MQMNQISLDINKSGQIINEPVVLRVGEEDQTITVNLLKDGQPYTSFTTATFFANKPSGAIVANDPANISNGVITYTVPQALVNEFGKITNAYFLIDGKTSTESFVIAVLQGVRISDDLNDYIPGMGNLNVIYDKWKAKLDNITRELTGIDAPKEVKNVIDNELKNYINQINDLKGGITAAQNQLDALEVPEVSTRNLLTGTRTLSNAIEIGDIALNSYQGCAIVTNPYTNKFPTGNYFNGYSAYPTVKCDKGDYTITFIAWADSDGDMIANYFFSSDTTTDTTETSQGIISHIGDGSAEITLTKTPKLYWIKWHNGTEGQFQKEVTLGRVMDKFSNGHTNKGLIHVGLPMFVNGSIPLPWMPAPEDKLDVVDTKNWQKQAIFRDGDYLLNACPKGTDFGDFLKSDSVPKGFSIIRDDNAPMNWRIVKEDSNFIYGLSQDMGRNAYHLEVVGGTYQGYKKVISDLIGQTITATDDTGKTVNLNVTGIS